jgi:hypothetical protein
MNLIRTIVGLLFQRTAAPEPSIPLTEDRSSMADIVRLLDDTSPTNELKLDDCGSELPSLAPDKELGAGWIAEIVKAQKQYSHPFRFATTSPRHI